MKSTSFWCLTLWSCTSLAQTRPLERLGLRQRDASLLEVRTAGHWSSGIDNDDLLNTRSRRDISEIPMRLFVRASPGRRGSNHQSSSATIPLVQDQHIVENDLVKHQLAKTMTAQAQAAKAQARANGWRKMSDATVIASYYTGRRGFQYAQKNHRRIKWQKLLEMHYNNEAAKHHRAARQSAIPHSNLLSAGAHTSRKEETGQPMVSAGKRPPFAPWLAETDLFPEQRPSYL